MSELTPERLTEIVQGIGDDCNDSGEATYDINVAMIDCLENMRAQDEMHKRRERFWKSGGAGIALAPLVAAGALVVSHEGDRMEIPAQMVTGLFAALASGAGAVVSVNRYDENRKRGQELATESAPVSFALNRTLQPWIEKRLSEKQEDIRRQKERLELS